MLRTIIRMTTAPSAALLVGCATGHSGTVEPRVTISQPLPVAAADDAFNVAMLSALTPGMIVTVRITPREISLQSARMMLVPRLPRKADGHGDRIIATMFGNGSQISQIAVTDPVIVFLEEGRQTRNEDRTVSLAIPTPSLVDTLEVTVTATRASSRFDISPVIEEYCARAKSTPTCQAVESDR